MSALQKYKQQAMARRQRDRRAGQRMTDAVIEGGGALLGGTLAGTLAIASPTIAGFSIDPGFLAGGGALAIELSGFADKGIAGKAASATLLGYSAGRMALRAAARKATTT